MKRRYNFRDRGGRKRIKYINSSSESEADQPDDEISSYEPSEDEKETPVISHPKKRGIVTEVEVIPREKRQKVQSESEFDSKESSGSQAEEDNESEADSESDADSDGRPDRKKLLEDFILDIDPLKRYLTSTLAKELKKDEKELEPIVKKILKNADETLIEYYCGAEPNDKRWKIGLDQKDIDRLEPILNKIRKELKDEIPTMEKILSAEISIDDKKKAVQLFDQLANDEPYTETYNDLCKEINGILKHKMSSKMDEEEKKIRDMAKGIESMQSKIFGLQCSEKTKAIIYNKYLKLKSLDPSDSEYGTLQEWLDWATRLPYQKMSEHKGFLSSESKLDTDEQISVYLTEIRRKLDERLYGMQSVKDALIEILNNRLSKGGTKGCLIALKGPAGTGKSEVAKAIADVIGMPFERISLGGIEDPSILRGTNKSWVGSSPSIILQSMARMGVSDGMIHLDEIDKLSESPKAKEVQYALLHVTDYATNDDFRDTFLSEIPHDLSRLWMVIAMNDDKKVDPILLDRLDVIEVPKYSRNDRIEILNRFILRKALKNVGLEENCVVLSEDAVNCILNMCNEEGGMRQMEKLVRTIVRKINLERRRHPKLFPLTISGDRCSMYLKDVKTEKEYLSIYI